MRERAYIVQDPYHPYAVRYMERLYERHRLRPICLYSDPSLRALFAERFPVLGSDLPLASHEVAPDALVRFAANARQRYDIVGALPYAEHVLEPAMAINDALRVGRNTLSVMRRFRNKHALKQHLRRADPNLRLNRSYRVSRASEAYAIGVRLGRYVVKPIDGYGNRTIGFFDASTKESDVARFFEESPGTSFVLEEYVGGREYFVNGQCDKNGHAEIYAIFEYVRVAANGRPNVDYLTRQVRSYEPAFAALVTYARQVIRASGLVCSPFHLEAKVDERGPCLIEVGARLVGNDNAFVTNALHGGAIDVFDVAADGYFAPEPVVPDGDFSCYDKKSTLYVHGIAYRTERVCRLDGLKEVEAMPEFAGWVQKPKRGERVFPSVDLFTLPYTVLLMGDDEAALWRAADEVRRLVRWNQDVSSTERFELELLAFKERLVRRATTLLTQTLAWL